MPASARSYRCHPERRPRETPRRFRALGEVARAICCPARPPSSRLSVVIPNAVRNPSFFFLSRLPCCRRPSRRRPAGAPFPRAALSLIGSCCTRNSLAFAPRIAPHPERTATPRLEASLIMKGVDVPFANQVLQRFRCSDYALESGVERHCGCEIGVVAFQVQGAPIDIATTWLPKRALKIKLLIDGSLINFFLRDFACRVAGN